VHDGWMDGMRIQNTVILPHLSLSLHSSFVIILTLYVHWRELKLTQYFFVNEVAVSKAGGGEPCQGPKQRRDLGDVRLKT
jgi:hypothetical protein